MSGFFLCIVISQPIVLNVIRDYLANQETSVCNSAHPPFLSVIKAFMKTTCIESGKQHNLIGQAIKCTWLKQSLEIAQSACEMSPGSLNKCQSSTPIKSALVCLTKLKSENYGHGDFKNKGRGLM